MFDKNDLLSEYKVKKYESVVCMILRLNDGSELYITGFEFLDIFNKFHFNIYFSHFIPVTKLLMHEFVK